MNKFLLIAVLLMAALRANGQNTAAIKGTLIDSLDKKPVEFATVAVIDMRDTLSTLIAYTLSNKEGAFALHNIPGGIPVKLLISYVAYQPYRKLFTLKTGEQFDLGTIGLNSKQLQEVTIKDERMPVVVRKDTIIFDAEAFKTRPNAVVEDLLKKLPGVEVDNDGNITVMAKKVSKVLVDGREFFPTDIRIATKNLDADLIDKVQVYDDRENDPNHLIPESQVGKIINLKFKKAIKKSIFGKVYAGAGTNDHYQVGGLANMFRDT
ncbi:carboxypeptidase-like regulatory domain-containing protein [Mucilaginibacter jinjuensis]|uniref:Carboxypeptidase-like regulatory domain-containing protein n=1 Tax=Mucilaginibacter jinjuensis TaxID=1176721 RepID=A0ABY7TCN2_9SPHI|nr:carboxypeptidase-like regulatory domain-containing protein [Mucilaginibacter jinjuensis]WCT13929.1 carboxypeptidase-like regulatory domain-containing protein [Mucilaginibacter jinjuensis]